MDRGVGRARVACALPTRGRADATRAANRRSQTRQRYDGMIEYLFAVECAADVARAGLDEVMDRASSARASARALEAGRAVGRSQKIHNVLCAFDHAHADAKYFLVLDDDVRVRPGTVETLVRAMESADGDEALLVTGYPFDVPSERAPFPTYMCAVFHMVLIVAFSQGRVTKNVWGGCMLLRAEDVRSDAHGIASAYRDGGYSDDLILAAIADREKKTILCPPTAVFPSYSDGCTFMEYWNYARRQQFVCLTYVDRHMMIINYLMLFAYTSLSAVFAAGAFISLAVLASWALEFVGSTSSLAGVGRELRWDACANVASFACAMASARAMYVDLGDICREDGDDSDVHQRVRRVSWTKMSLAFLCAHALAPAVSAVVLASSTCVWGDATYAVTAGRVRRIA